VKTPDRTPREDPTRIPTDGDSPADPVRAEESSVARAAIERGRDDERSRWGLVVVASVLLLVLVVVWKWRAIVALFAEAR
jgi:hypothetical protein